MAILTSFVPFYLAPLSTPPIAGINELTLKTVFSGNLQVMRWQAIVEVTPPVTRVCGIAQGISGSCDKVAMLIA